MYDFTFKGINSRDLGITVNRRPPRESANTRSTITEIDGVDGGYIEKVGLNTYVMEFDMTIEGLHNVEKISGWLQGQGEFRRSDLPGKALWVEHQAPIEFEYLTDDLYTCTTTFYVVDPTWYLVEDDWHEPWGANLIPDGWDSFEPYGYEGKETRAPLEVFEEGYVRNILPEKFEEFIREIPTENNYEATRYDVSKYKGNGVSITSVYGAQTTYDEVAVGLYNMTVYKWVAGPVIYKIQNGRMTSGVFEIPNDNDKYSITEYFGKSGHTGGQVGHIIDRGVFLNGKTSKIYPRWEDIPEKDKPVRAWDNMAVHMTPLENGLTRIQTWGGNSYTKLRSSRIQNNIARVASFYLTDNNFIRVWDSYTFNSFTSSGNYDGQIIYGMDSRSTRLDIQSNSIYGNLDFIASDPIIVKGDKAPTWNAGPNPSIVNEGNYKSKPIIKIEKGTTDLVDVVIGKTRFLYEFKENDKSVTIDCEAQTAVDEQGINRIRNLKIGYEFPTLRPGPNTVKIIDGDAKITFRRKDRWR